MPDPRTTPQPGILAHRDGPCPRCPDPIVGGQSRVVYVAGWQTHVECFTSGGDEE